MKHIIAITVCSVLVLGQYLAVGQGISFVCPDTSVTLCEPDIRIDLPSNNQSILGIGTPGATSCRVHVRLNTEVTGDCGIIVKYIIDYVPFGGSDRFRIQDTSEAFLNSSDEGSLSLDTRLLGTNVVLSDGLPYNDQCPSSDGAFHTIWWYAFDECGNVDSCQMLLRLEDCLPPIAEPVDVTNFVFPVSQEVTITAKELIEEAVDDCDPINWILYSFEEDIFIPTKRVNCDTIIENGGPLFEFDIWVADRGPDINCNNVNEWSERNKVKVRALVAFDDDCAGEIFDGTILSENGVPVEGAIISFFGNGPVETIETDSDGEYRLPEIDTNEQWTIIPTKVGDEEVGVSTLDLIKIQKHLLEIEPFSTPYKRIAADANNNQAISATDLLELKKLILTITSTLPNNTSWRFVPKSFVFADPEVPWPFPETSNLDELDFVGVKVGDVNGTVSAPNGVRTGFPIELKVLDDEVEEGEIVSIPVSVSNRTQLQALQFTLELEGLELIDVKGEAIQVDAGTFARHKKDAVTFAWFAIDPISVDDQDVLFWLLVRAKQTLRLNESIALTSRLTSAVAYSTIDDADIESSVHLTFAPIRQMQGAIHVFPNPFTEFVTIAIPPSECTEVEISVLSQDGRVLNRRTIPVEGNGTRVTLESAFFDDAPGVYILRIDGDKMPLYTKKIVFVGR